MNDITAQRLELFLVLFKKNEHYVTLQQAQQTIDCDQGVQAHIAQFEQAKETFEEAQRFGKYHPDYQMYQRALSQAKRALDLDPTIQQYKQAQKMVQDLLNQMSIALGTNISPHVVVPSDFFTGLPSAKKSCGSSCNCG
ncbi:MAG: YlbF family regulator [Culicoidibacterales bacterium]